MFYLDVPTIEGIKKEVVYNVDDFNYSGLFNLPTCNGKKGNYYNIACTFDIESTTIEPPKDGENYLYNPYSFMYQWQFCIDKKVIMGRTWEEFQRLLRNLKRAMGLSKFHRLVIYVHNLAYEFQFMKEFIKIETMFSKDTRKPMKIQCNNGFEFRCSYFLSNMSLIKFCENSKLCKYYKLEDNYDYNKIRTPKTELTNTELAYCYNDVMGLAECIDTMLLEDTIATIPLTNTGYVRREYREVMKTKKNRDNFVKTQLTAEQYEMMKKAFRGGNTHANRFYANTVLKKVFSFDISSSYPTAIMECDFPVGKFMEVTIDSQKKLDYYCENYCCVFNVTFFNLQCKFDCVIPYVDIAHCEEMSNIVNDNGRVLSADLVTITCTNIDLDIIRETYDFKGFLVNKAIYSEKGKLPIELRRKLMHFYELKTLLKGVEGKEYEYMKSKNRLNSTFGMMVTDFCHDDIKYNTETMEWETIKGDIDSSIEQFYKSRNNFLSYQWGVFVTAHARRRLQDMLNVVKTDVVYIDTDSIKFINEEHIKEFEKANEKLIEIAENNDIKAYIDREEEDGSIERFYLGTWDNDGNYDKFKTLGAKKYCYHKTKKGKDVFEVTVSGMSKKLGSERVGSIENFLIGKTYTNIGRTTSWYNDEEIHKITINGDTFTTASNIGILETSYTLGVTNEYWELIKGNIGGVTI